LYNSFLLSELGGEKYLELYKDVNGDLEFVKTIDNVRLKLPVYNLFGSYLDKYIKDVMFYVDPLDTVAQNHHFAPFAFKNNFRKFFIYKDFQFGPDDEFYEQKINSKISKEVLDNGIVRNQYCIICDSNSLKVFDFYNDELIFSYDISLSVTQVYIPIIHGRCIIYLNESLFKSTFKKSFHWEVKR